MIVSAAGSHLSERSILIRRRMPSDIPGVLRLFDRLLVALGVALVLGTGGVALLSQKDGGGEQSASASQVEGPVSKEGRVGIKAFKYMPAALTVKAGSKVTFVNDDTADHTATSTAGGAFDTDRIEKGKSGSVTLRKPGSFDYICAYHPFMKGKIRVVP
ncbi:MAG TPA: cupredoxin family copper-binding protein [Thermoleophilaceae bacterium]|nr:cupredoxin family copper-binding protein [Thermoleophilaceae bacterium]